jgi:hypothetical protein
MVKPFRPAPLDAADSLARLGSPPAPNRRPFPGVRREFLTDETLVRCDAGLHVQQNAYGIATPDNLLLAHQQFFPRRLPDADGIRSDLLNRGCRRSAAASPTTTWRKPRGDNGSAGRHAWRMTQPEPDNRRCLLLGATPFAD